MGVRHPRPPSPAGRAPPSPAVRARGCCVAGRAVASPSPALRERVPRAARRVRVGSRNFIYREPLSSRNAQQERSPAPPILDRCRAADVVGAARSPLVAIQIPPSAPNWAIHRRLRLHVMPIGDRTGRRSARGQCGGCPSGGLARTSGLGGNPLLEQRRPRQYQWRALGRPENSPRNVDPHPPSPAGRAPPSPAMRERGSPRLLPTAPLPHRGRGWRAQRGG
jgi:hypothetical protein